MSHDVETGGYRSSCYYVKEGNSAMEPPVRRTPSILHSLLAFSEFPRHYPVWGKANRMDAPVRVNRNRISQVDQPTAQS